MDISYYHKTQFNYYADTVKLITKENHCVIGKSVVVCLYQTTSNFVSISHDWFMRREHSSSLKFYVYLIEDRNKRQICYLKKVDKK